MASTLDKLSARAQREHIKQWRNSGRGIVLEYVYHLFSMTESRRHHSRSVPANIHPQPFSWKAGFLFVASGLGLIFYFRYEKARMERKRVAEATKGVGRPKVGGKFELVDQEGRPFTDEDLRGKYGLVS
jgi:hypothetical protein